MISYGNDFMQVNKMLQLSAEVWNTSKKASSLLMELEEAFNF